MKSLVAKLLIVVCLFSMTPMKEIAKVPLLYLHFLEHINESPELSFSKFLNIHYFHGIVFDEDYEKDMQLPFKTVDFNLLPMIVFHENNDATLPLIINIFEDHSNIKIGHDTYISEAKLKGIFHPPKMS